MKTLAECWGGPLDGRPAPFPQEHAFPWPRGWYYLDPTHHRFFWRDQPGTFVGQDRDWLVTRAAEVNEYLSRFPREAR